MKTPKPSDKSGSPIFTTNEQTPKSRGWFAYLFGGRREFILCILVLLGMIGMVMKGCSTIQKGIKEINDVEKKLQR